MRLRSDMYLESDMSLGVEHEPEVGLVHGV